MGETERRPPEVHAEVQPVPQPALQPGAQPAGASRKGFRRLLVLAIAIGALTGLFVFGILRDPARRDDIPSALLDRAAPTFELPLFARYQGEYGATLDTAEVSRPLVVNFWASWCFPCREEMPVLQASWLEHQSEVLFVGVNTQERSQEGARALMDEFNLTYPNGSDPASRINIDYGLFGLPETFFIRADGTLQYRHSGAVTPELMNEQIEKLVSG